MRRHIEWVNSLGYDAVSFDLSFNNFKSWVKVPLNSSLQFGLRHVWAEEIAKALNSVSEKKILYSFSLPSSGAAEALAERRCTDVKAWICDGGPFLRLFRCFFNYAHHQANLHNPALKLPLALTAYQIFPGRNFAEDMNSCLSQFPKGFPVLNIRGWADPLVPPVAIDEVFAPHRHLDFEALALPEGRHIDGLKNHAQEYTPRVENFLKLHSTAHKSLKAQS